MGAIRCEAAVRATLLERPLGAISWEAAKLWEAAMPAILLERPLGAIRWEAAKLWEAATPAIPWERPLGAILRELNDSLSFMMDYQPIT